MTQIGGNVVCAIPSGSCTLWEVIDTEISTQKNFQQPRFNPNEPSFQPMLQFVYQVWIGGRRIILFASKIWGVKLAYCIFNTSQNVVSNLSTCLNKLSIKSKQ